MLTRLLQRRAPLAGERGVPPPEAPALLVRLEGGFPLIELLVVIVIIGILLAIAVPSYLHFKDNANQKAAAANVRSTLPAVEAYFADYNAYANAADPDGAGPLAAGTFNEAFLKANYDAGLSSTVVVKPIAA